MFGWLLLDVYVLDDFLYFVDVLFQTGVFSIRFMVVGGLDAEICKTYMCTPRNRFGGLRTKVGGTFGNFTVPPRVFCQVWLNVYLSLRINMQ